MKMRFHSMVAERAEGSRIWDVDGKEYLDFVSQWGVTNIGNCHPKVVASVKEQAERLLFSSHLTFPNVPSIELAEKLIEITPGNFAKKVWFGLSGSDASEMVYKVMPAWTGRRRFLSFLGSYHGSNMGGVTLSGFRALSRFVGFGDAIKVPYPDRYRCTFCSESSSCSMACLDYVEQEILPHYPTENISSVVVEPVQSDAGEIVPPPEFLPRLYELCRSYGIKFVDDEVKVGFGRTGKMFAIEHSRIEPDVIITGKSMGAGMPLGAVIGPAEMMDSLRTAHASTHGGQPVCCAAALASIGVIEGDGLSQNARRLGDVLLKRLGEIREKQELVGHTRGLGLVMGVELVRDRKTKEPAAFETLCVAYRAWELGLIVGVMGTRGNVLELMPSLNISDEEADEGMEILERSIDDVAKGRIDKQKVERFAEA
jgi:4-aminobutyrate aminotransferase